MPFFCQLGKQTCYRVCCRCSLADAKWTARLSIGSGFDFRLPDMITCSATLPPHEFVALGRHLVRRQRAILRWVPLCRDFGNKLSRLFCFDGLIPRQYGQPPDPAIRLLIKACQSFLHLGQSHQAFLFAWAATAPGVTLPFLVGCHSFAIAGYRGLQRVCQTNLLTRTIRAAMPVYLRVSLRCHSVRDALLKNMALVCYANPPR